MKAFTVTLAVLAAAGALAYARTDDPSRLSSRAAVLGPHSGTTALSTIPIEPRDVASKPALLAGRVGTRTTVPLTAAERPRVPAVSLAKDSTRFDCRETVAVRYVEAKPGRIVKLWEVKECPHKEMMASGGCVESFWGGMRCKN